MLMTATLNVSLQTWFFKFRLLYQTVYKKSFVISNPNFCLASKCLAEDLFIIFVVTLQNAKHSKAKYVIQLVYCKNSTCTSFSHHMFITTLGAI